MSRIRKAWTNVVLATAVVGSVTAVAGAGAAHADGTAPGYEVIASKLNNPRGITVLGDGTVYVAEGGLGKPGCAAGTECAGPTGSVYRYGGGKSGRVLTGLQSIATAPQSAQQPVTATGPTDVAVTRRGLVVLNGGGTDAEHRAGLGAAANRAGTLYSAKSGRVIADLAQYETDLDPDWVLQHQPTQNEPSTVHSNAFHFTPARDGGYLVVDAGGNDLLRVSPSGRISTVTVFPDSKLDDGTSAQAVPTGVVQTSDGTIYVSDMGGIKPGASRIWKILPGKKPQVFAKGLNALSDLALDHAGNLIALSMTGGYTQTGPTPGKLFKVDTKTKDITEIPTGDKLSMATAVGVGPHNEIYVVNKSSGADGELVRITP